MTKYSSWNHYFRHNNWSVADLCPPGLATLSAEERELIGASLQQFQLGEGSDGLGLLRRANEFSKRHNVDSLPEAMQRFVCEEQRHSAVLGLFLDRESIPRLQNHWADHLFRRIRNLAGFELMLTVLVTAEFIAIPYYTAIHDATKSECLRRIAKRILSDEAQHLEFQAENLGLCAASRGELGRLGTIAFQWVVLSLASALVYSMHKRLFEAAGFTPLRFWSMAFEAHKAVFQKLTRGALPVAEPVEAYLR
jgi:hypothetical protein